MGKGHCTSVQTGRPGGVTAATRSDRPAANHASATHSPPTANAAATATAVVLIASTSRPPELIAGDEGARGRERWPIGIAVGHREQLLVVGLRGRLVAERLGRLGGADEPVEAI